VQHNRRASELLGLLHALDDIVETGNLLAADLEDHIARVDDAISAARAYAPQGAEVARLERTRNELLAEITNRQQRIAALELELNRYEAQNLLELEQRRQQAEAELRQEREALRRLEERLRRVESQNPQRPPQR